MRHLHIERWRREPRHSSRGERWANRIAIVLGTGMLVWTGYIVWGWF